MKQQIIESINDPETLEMLFRKDKSGFTLDFADASTGIETDLVRFWQIRLKKESAGHKHQLLKTDFMIVGILSVVIALLVKSHLLFSSITMEDYLFRNLTIIAFSGLTAWFIIKNRVTGVEKILLLALPVVILTVFLNLLPEKLNDTSKLAFIHAPLFMWFIFGLAWVSFNIQIQRKFQLLSAYFWYSHLPAPTLKMIRSCFIICAFFLIVNLSLYSQAVRPRYNGNNYVTIRPGETPEQIIEKAASVTPSANQLEWQRLEFIAFIHFGINTFTGSEWGTGSEDPLIFNPAQLDARQWVRTARDAGMKMVIITAKHHDGFCLWPSKYTSHTVAASPWKKGKGDVVGEVAAACAEYGLKFGFYLSPWDKHEPSYSNSEKYNEFFRNQLRELLTRYGEVSEVWFDGACGEGANGKKQVYDWKSYYTLIRELQPGAVIAIMGPDVRWVGTESGRGRPTEWSIVPDVVQNLDSVAASSQQYPLDGAFLPGDLTGSDLGSRDKLKNAKALVWYPAETDVSIRPGWFYHAADDDRVKSPEKLAGIYFSSVGMNSVLLLNIPPDKRGLIHDNDVRNLKGMKKIIDRTFQANILDGAVISVSGTSIEYALAKPASFNTAMIREDIKVGQRIEQFHLEAWDGKSWNTFTGGTTVGYKRILQFPTITAQKVKLVTDASRLEPAIMNFGLYNGPAIVEVTKKVRKTDGILSLGTACSLKYPGSGPFAVTDGIRGSGDFTDGSWQGYEGNDFIATMDLGRIRSFSTVWAGFLQQQGSWIFMPSSVEYFVSDDGKEFRCADLVKNTLDEKDEGIIIRDFTAKIGRTKARYIRIHAHNRGVCPAWHPGAGDKTWIFVDEIGIK